MQQQHLMQMQPMMAAYASSNQVTTDVIQQYLDENKQLILAILENQNSGKAEECAENQAKLQRNLMYLAAIADSQPQMPTVAQYPPNAAMQTSGLYMNHHQHQQQHQQQMTPQSLMAAQRSSMLYAQSPMSGLSQQQQASMHAQLTMSSMPTGNTSNSAGFPILHGEATLRGNGAGFPDFARAAAGKQDTGASYLKASEEEGNN